MSTTKYQIQFQKGLGLPKFIKDFGTEEQCERYLIELKWGRRFKCPKCGQHHASAFRRRGRPYFQCSVCRHQTSLTAGTLFHGSHLPLTTWFLALYLVSEAKTQLSSLELHRLIHVNHKTAWLMLHKIMQVMVNAEQARKLTGRIEMDDAYLGGKRSGGKSGRGAAGKQPFLAAIQTSDDDKPHYRPHYAKIAPVKGFSLEEVELWTRNNITKGSHVVSDALQCFKGVESTCSHEVHTANKMTEAQKKKHFQWVNTVLSNVKTGLTGAFHSFDCSKYSFRYLGAVVYRFNRRFNLDLIFLDLVEDISGSPPINIHSIRL